MGQTWVMTVYNYKLIRADGLNPLKMFERLAENITESEEQGWEFVQFLDAAGILAVVRKAK